MRRGPWIALGATLWPLAYLTGAAIGYLLHRRNKRLI